MSTLQIIQATPGLTTSEQILEQLQTHPQGLTLKELSQHLNRPVSMVQICLKLLIAMKHIQVRRSQSSKCLVYLRQFNKLSDD